MTKRRGEAALDLWTGVHLLSGVGLAILGLPWTWAVALILAYEAIEAGLRRIKLEEGGLFEYESWANIVIDILVGLAGFFAWRALWPALRVFHWG